MDRIEARIIDVEGETPAEVIEFMGKHLEAIGLVNYDYVLALQERENSFPTGLRVTKNFAVALPHAKEGIINSSVICVGLPRLKVNFRLMDNPGELRPVNLVMLMAIKNPKSHLQILKRLMDLIQNQQFIDLVKEADKEGISLLLDSVTTKNRGYQSEED